MTNLIQDLISMIQKRPHSKKHLSAIMAKYTGYILQQELDRYLDKLMEAESRAADYLFYNKHIRGKPDYDEAVFEKMEKEIQE